MKARLVLFGVLVLCPLPYAWACGPFFPNAYLLFGDEARVLKMPEAWFHLLLPEVASHSEKLYPTRRTSQWSTLGQGSLDLMRALGARGDDYDEISVLVGRYSSMHTEIINSAPLPNAARESAAPDETTTTVPESPFDFSSFEELLATIPTEFALYARGAAAYRGGDTETAIAHWKEILDLPETERPYRSTWAAYMLGRALFDTGQTASNGYFGQVSQLADAGFHDSLNLAADARGWLARSAFVARDFRQAVHRYLELFLDGPPLQSREAAESLRMVCRAAFTQRDAMDALASDVVARRVMTAWVLGHPEEDVAVIRDWLSTVPPEDTTPEDSPLAHALARLDGALTDGVIDPEVQAELRTLAQSGYYLSMANSTSKKTWYPRERPTEGDLRQAMYYYIDSLEHASTPQARADANTSVDFVCARVAARPELFDEFAADPVCRPIMTAWLVSHPHNYPDVDAQWLDAVQNAVGTGPVEHADRLAWIAYNDGDMERAAQWLESADANSPYARWIQSKLLLREGRIDEALNMLRETIPAFPPDAPTGQGEFGPMPPEQEIVQSEIGVLLLGRQDYVNALDALMRSPYWTDAAYVAERVLTIDELRAYVDAHRDDPALSVTFTERFWYESELPKLALLDYLLARRYARQGQWEEAAASLPDTGQMQAEELRELLATANAPIPPKSFASSVSSFVSGFWGAEEERVIDRQRANALSDAAELTRRHGMELMGTELDPDWFVFGGNYELTGISQLRAESYNRENADYDPALIRTLAASDDELQRAAAHAPEPDKRFHYRYVASGLMWQAAQYLPDNDLKCASALYWGGAYLQNRDPQAADKFYKALVWRNLNLPYAQRADKLRWFPPEPPE